MSQEMDQNNPQHPSMKNDTSSSSNPLQPNDPSFVAALTAAITSLIGGYPNNDNNNNNTSSSNNNNNNDLNGSSFYVNR